MRKWFIAVAVTTLAIFASTIGGEFLWDDQQFVLENQFLKSWSDFPRLFTENIVAGAGMVSNIYRPLQSVTHFIDTKIWGDWPMGHHLSNILIMVLLAILLFRYLLSLMRTDDFRAKMMAFVITLLYVAHPLQSQIVGYISGRGDLLVIVFLLIAVLNFKKRFWLTILATLFGILSKENGLLIPAFILIHDFFTADSKEDFFRRWSKHGILYLALRMTVLNFQDFTNFFGKPNVFTENFKYRLLTYFTSFAKGLSIWFWPYDLHHERHWKVYTDLSTMLTVVGIGLWVSMGAMAIWLIKKMPMASMGFIWFLGATIPTSNLFIIINALFYDHWFIFPGLGLCLILIGMTNRWVLGKKWSPQIIYISGFLLSCMIGTEIYATQIQNTVWRTPENLYRHILEYEPDSEKMMNNLAMYLSEHGQEEDAKNLYLKAISMGDTFAQTHHNLALIYLNEKKYSEAESEFKVALKMDPTLYQSLTYWGILEFKQGKIKEAIPLFEQSLKLHATKAGFEGVIRSYQAVGDQEKSMEYQQRARQLGLF
jgi:hypothetical protein